MADIGPTTRRWWVWPFGILLFLLILTASLVFVAQAVYVKADSDGLRSVLATGVLLNGAVVVVLGAIVTTSLSLASDMRADREREADKRLELFHRMRAAHVHVALAQQILRVRPDSGTYDEQMRTLLQVAKDLGEIREEVRVSGRLYDEVDRRLIMKGIALILIYLQTGVDEYVDWSKSKGQLPTTRPSNRGAWVVELVTNSEMASTRKTLSTEDVDWEPKGGMPAEYDDGLEQSKLIMRAYVYAASRKARAALREEVSQRVTNRAIIHDDLTELNREIAVRETVGDEYWFDDVLLADDFVMRPADLTSCDRAQFLARVGASAKRRTENIVVAYRTDHTAIVTCTVRMVLDDGWAACRNARLFVRNRPDLPWRLLAWANDPPSNGSVPRDLRRSPRS